MCAAPRSVHHGPRITHSNRDGRTGRHAHPSGAKGVDFLTPDVIDFTNTNQCVACHRQGAALYGLSLAKGAGFNVSSDLSAGIPSIAATVVNDEQSAGWWIGVVRTTSRPATIFMVSRVTTRTSRRLIRTSWLPQRIGAISIQQSDGHWIMDFEDGQTAHGDVTVTARFMVGIAQAMQRVDANKAATYKTSLNKAVSYITAHENDSNDVTGVGLVYELSWAIVGLKAAGLADTDPTVLAFVALLEARQSSLGFAWGNYTNDVPDVFNSGMAIYALLQSRRACDRQRVASAVLELGQRSTGHRRHLGQRHLHDVRDPRALLLRRLRRHREQFGADHQSDQLQYRAAANGDLRLRRAEPRIHRRHLQPHGRRRNAWLERDDPELGRDQRRRSRHRDAHGPRSRALAASAPGPNDGGRDVASALDAQRERAHHDVHRSAPANRG